MPERRQLASHDWRHRLLIGVSGRPLAILVLIIAIATKLFAELLPQGGVQLPNGVAAAASIVDIPLVAARDWVFDSFEKLDPRIPVSQPVTVVAIDEKSLASIGQWPWPRTRMANLIRTIQAQNPAAIGLDLYMPEVDQNSPDQLAKRLPPELMGVGQRLQQLPSNDAVLAQAMSEAPVVLGVAGFDFKTYTTTTGVRSVPVKVTSGDPAAYVRRFPYVLASLPELQAASHGQAMLSVDAGGDRVRRVPLLGAVGSQLLPGMAMEMLRVGTGSTSVDVSAGPHGIRAVSVADLSVPTQSNGEIYLHFARLSSGLSRYVSAADVLNGSVDPDFFNSKLVMIGLTGLGLNDMRTTALGELVPGIEIQAQTLEALFDGALLQRPWWSAWLELALVTVLCGILIWLLPRSDMHLARRLKLQPPLALGMIVVTSVLMLVVSYGLFRYANWLFDAAFVAILFALVIGLLIVSEMIESLADARIKLGRLVANGIALGQEQQRPSLLRMALEGACELARCRAATIFLKTDRDTLICALSTVPGAEPTMELPLTGLGDGEVRSVPVEVALSGRSLFIDDVEREARYRLAKPEECGNMASMHCRTTLAVPMTLNGDEIIGVIQLFDAIDPASERIIPFEPNTLGFIEALAGQSAVAIRNLDLVEAQKTLMDSMIQLIAGAIDTKSPYTGAHCERVPELALMLAEAACEVKTGPLADFSFQTDEEWREFRIGAWLHDCGKVTTPEYVVDKATKLETIFNRIHEIRTRFEVLLRDAEIERLTAIHERGQDATSANQRFEAEKAALIDDFEFVAECNLGTEFMAPERIERLNQIANRTWWRNFNDRLGLSFEEQNRFKDSPPEPLPFQEKLLIDKPHHLFERRPSKALDPRYGFKLTVPEYLYNHGELHNLSISRGTLTAEERFKINEHIIQSIVMLEQMPLPKELKRVPEYAGTHHETLIGTGYPRRLTEKELSVPARIMAIADIFEALTASDRPYKKAKSLSEAIKILSFFRNDKHIDPHLFDLFLTSGIYRTYAERFLAPEQIDEVDIGQFVT